MYRILISFRLTSHAHDCTAICSQTNLWRFIEQLAVFFLHHLGICVKLNFEFIYLMTHKLCEFVSQNQWWTGTEWTVECGGNQTISPPSTRDAREAESGTVNCYVIVVHVIFISKWKKIANKQKRSGLSVAVFCIAPVLVPVQPTEDQQKYDNTNFNIGCGSKFYSAIQQITGWCGSGV